MSAELRSKMETYSKYLEIIRANREKEAEYFNRIDKVLASSYDIDLADFNISPEQFEKRESKLISTFLNFNRYTNCTITVYMSYSSPKGQVNIDKQQSFDFKDIEVAFNSISRTYLDRKTYQGLVNVERGEISDSLRYDIMNRDGFRCVICGASANEGVRLHVDHIVPVSKGGKSTPDNLRTLCERCNVGKSNKIETGFDDESNISSKDICPRCNGKLILRNGSRGEFYGCSNYPKCKYTRSK